jgi:hypothetical protein
MYHKNVNYKTQASRGLVGLRANIMRVLGNALGVNVAGE